MMRVFYVTQGQLLVIGAEPGTEDLSFLDSDDGLRQFENYLQRAADQPSLMLIDIIEEEFVADPLPKVGARDRSALLESRLRRKFPRTPYRVSASQQARGNKDVAIYSAVTNRELLDPWLQIIAKYRTPLTGIYSVPLVAPQILARVYKARDTVLLLTQHQGMRLRQVVVRGGNVQSARLSKSPPLNDSQYPDFVVDEIEKIRRYLERTRLLSSKEQLAVCMIAESDISEEVLKRVHSRSPMQFHCVKPRSVAKKIRSEEPLEPDRLERLYIAAALRKRPRNSYATSGENRYWHLRRLRDAIIGSAVAASVLLSAMAGWYFSEAWHLRQATTEIESQVRQLTDTFHRDNEMLDPIKADSHEMKLAVDTGDYILENRLPVPWVMHQLGQVMGEYPDVHIQQLSWRAEGPVSDTPQPQSRGSSQLPLPIPSIVAVSVVIAAELRPFDGDMRYAFARIDELSADIRERTRFGETFVIEYPWDASPTSAVSGEISGASSPESAGFRLRLTYRLQPAAGQTVENEDGAA